MRDIIAITQVSLDNVMQGPGSADEDPSNGFVQGGWAMAHRTEEGSRIIGEFIAGDFDLLVGRRTYDIWESYWPKQTEHPIGKAFNKATKYVVTHRPSSLTWKTSQAIGGDIVEEVRRLKASVGPALQLWGSSEVVQKLVAAGMIDEHRLLIFPVLVGSGKRLFENGIAPRTFRLVSSQSTPTGVLVNTYR